MAVRAPHFQRKAPLGPVDHPLEREADRMVDAVTRDDAAGAIGAAPAAGRAPSAGGAPLSPALRAYFEPRFRRDLAGVRVHTDGAAASAARSIGARAFTLGADIGFAARQFAPESAAGRRLLAHELAHVAQGGDTIRRQPEDPKATEGEPGDGKPKETDPPRTSLARELFGYPLIVDLWSDIFAQKLTDEHKEAFKRKGTEGMAMWNLLFGAGLAMQSPEVDGTLGGTLGTWLRHAKEIHEIAGSEDFHLDLFSTFTGISMKTYFESDLFKQRLSTHWVSAIALLGVGQTLLSTYQRQASPSAEVGEFEPEPDEKHSLLLKGVLNLALSDQIKAPDFFTYAPLRLATHPVYAASSATAGEASDGIVFEHRRGQGQDQGGEALKLGLTLNLAQIAAGFQKDAPSGKDIADLRKYRGRQSSLWFNYNKTDPTKLQEQAGKLAQKDLDVGTLFGGGGKLFILQGGARYGGDEADELTAWFLRGGFGYSGKEGARLQKIGFTATYTDWKEQDILAPKLGAGEASVGGWAAQFAPFAKREFGSRRQFSVGAALNFVAGSHEGLGLSGASGDFTYTSLGDSAEGGLPAFELKLGAFADRLDWFGPNSPLLGGLSARVNVGQFFAAAQVSSGAQNISGPRSALIKNNEKVWAPTAVRFTFGWFF